MRLLPAGRVRFRLLLAMSATTLVSPVNFLRQYHPCPGPWTDFRVHGGSGETKRSRLRRL